ncbi:glycosyltransferase family 2 protein [Candidatus Sumerlaeota bacterium]|nr:glycosyltransferase family 2 protein [Candidatus Sumerlaeota bacterium]
MMNEIENKHFQRDFTPRLSVIIPTHNRPDALEQLLASIQAQTSPAAEFEVLVIDDGSPEPATQENRRLAKHDWPFALLYAHQASTGPAIARNRMTERSRAPIVLFLNDDVTLNPVHFTEHLRLHAENPAENIVVRGWTNWPPMERDTPLMCSLRSRTFRYDYDVLPGEEHWIYFHTCDLSLKRSLLLRHPFDEEFPYASFEDTELGYRLCVEESMRLILAPEAVSEHRHDYDWRAMLRRARVNGKSAALLIRKHPYMAQRLLHHFYPISRRRRLIRAIQRWFQHEREGFWEDLEMFIYLRALERTQRLLNKGVPIHEV